MARALRILVAGGWYHVTSRGNYRARLFQDDEDRERFLGLVAELPERFAVEIHAFVLMDNHYHLLIRTPEANLSHPIRWLNVSYSCWSNARHRQTGHVFQGRFKAVLIQDKGGVCEVARHVHLNPVRVKGLRSVSDRVAHRPTARAKDSGRALVSERLKILRDYRWSSWRVYGGSEEAPKWLETGVVGGGCGGRTRTERARALRVSTEKPIREGRIESPWENLVGGLVLGDDVCAPGGHRHEVGLERTDGASMDAPPRGMGADCEGDGSGAREALEGVG